MLKISEEEFFKRWKEKNKYIVVSKYEGFDKNIIIKDDYGELITKPLYLVKNRPLSILSAINKTDYIINKFKEKNGDLYNYNKFLYLNAYSKGIITCPIHGDFEMTSSNHLKGHGCYKCNVSKNGYSKKDFINRGKNKICKLYLIKCWNDNEEFFKIGITSQKIKYRFIRYRDMPYNYEILYVIKNIDASYIYENEKIIKRIFKNERYEPNIKFAGYKECYSIKIVDTLTNHLIDLDNKMSKIKVNCNYCKKDIFKYSWEIEQHKNNNYKNYYCNNKCQNNQQKKEIIENFNETNLIKCSNCKIEKHYSEFSKCKKNILGFQNYCKLCFKNIYNNKK